MDRDRGTSMMSVSVYSTCTTDLDPQEDEVRQEVLRPCLKPGRRDALKRMGSVDSTGGMTSGWEDCSPSVSLLGYRRDDKSPPSSPLRGREADSISAAGSAICEGGPLEERERQLEHEDGNPSAATDEDLLQHWRTFVSAGSPLQVSLEAFSTSTAPLSPVLRSVSPVPAPFDKQTLDATRRPPLPNTTCHLRARSIAESRKIAPLPLLSLFPSFREDRGGPMTRVDSQVLSAILALKRLGSTEFEGDALNRLSREPSIGGTGVGLMREPSRLRLFEVSSHADAQEELSDAESGVGDWWDQVSVINDDNDNYTEEDHSPPTSASDLSTAGSWKWHSGSRLGGASGPRRRSTTSTNRTSLSLEQLELDFARFSSEYCDERESAGGSKYTSSNVLFDMGEEQEDEEDKYVCVLDLVQDDSSDGFDDGDDDEEKSQPAWRRQDFIPPPPPFVPTPLSDAARSSPPPTSRIPRFSPVNATTSRGSQPQREVIHTLRGQSSIPRLSSSSSSRRLPSFPSSTSSSHSSSPPRSRAPSISPSSSLSRSRAPTNRKIPSPTVKRAAVGHSRIPDNPPMNFGKRRVHGIV